MALDRINDLLRSCTTQHPLFPRTELYNARWLLRLVLDWFASQPDRQHPLAVPAETRWFSEARLPTAFLRRYKGDRLAETHTIVDGMIGQFDIGAGTRTSEIVLHRDASHLVVLVGTLFTPLGEGLRHARYYDQAARTVGCIAEALRRVDRFPVDVPTLAFYVVAPHAQIAAGTFAESLNREAIRQKGEQRAAAYGKEKKSWYAEWFLPTIEQLTVDTVAWETMLDTIQHHDLMSGQVLTQFYQQCLAFN